MSNPKGTLENLGRSEEDVHSRLHGPAALRAGLLLRDELGDIDDARNLLARLIAVLDEIGAQPGAPED